MRDPPKRRWNLGNYGVALVYQMDFVILGIGRFNEVPNIPEFPPDEGPKAFRGNVIYFMDYVAMDYESEVNFIKGKQKNSMIRVEKGSIILKKSQNIRFCRDGVWIDGEAEPVKIDLVILATRFRGDRKLKQIFASPAFQDPIAGFPKATIPLYRECIQPRIPQLAIIGFSESLANLYTSEMRCRWLAELLDGIFRVPGIKEMEEQVKI
ncbi:dimethylaniline monooxygenase, putative [Ricinus communis]|uniref:Flavin-containing monooxygenase n=1 Tax=Ricinus communis TaxID=3988 RepID=B9SIJ0_RICCO|nr:dimethylaniline monooxygenase, putative [Ricinus communis]